VLGGMFAFGIVGLFIGPVILAVTSAILNAWINEQPPLAQVEPTIGQPAPSPAVLGPNDAVNPPRHPRDA
jgi:hypothetical protein